MSTILLNARNRWLPHWRPDFPVTAIVIILALMAFLVPDEAWNSVDFTLTSLISIAPYLLVSVLFAAGARATGFDRQIARIFGGNAVASIVLAAAFGAVSPFCSCGVIPIVAGLLGAGVPLAPVMAFWLASPLMDPEMLILMLPVFPVDFIAAKAGAAFLLGAGGGFLVHALRSVPAVNTPLKDSYAGGGGCSSTKTMEATPVVWQFWADRERSATFWREFRVTGLFLGKWLALAFLLESLMLAYLAPESVAAWLGGGAWWAIPLAAAIGMPSYLNGYAAIPTVAGLIELGMSPGAGLAFMIAGGVSSIPAAMSVFALVRAPVFALYLLLGALGALLAGYGFELLQGIM